MIQNINKRRAVKANNTQHVAFDEISRTTIESLKRGLCASADYKRFEPLLDWGYSMADAQMACHIRDLVTCEVKILLQRWKAMTIRASVS